MRYTGLATSASSRTRSSEPCCWPTVRRFACDDLRLGDTATGAPRDAASMLKIPPTGIALEEIERLALIEALKMSNWVQKDAAELLAISPRVMNYKIKTLGIDFPRGRRAAYDAGAGPRFRCDALRGEAAVIRGALADAPCGRHRAAAPRSRAYSAASSRAATCPSSSWMARRSAPRWSRCVANECRSACGLMPNRVLHAAT